jgi:hypothetical protein
VWLVVEYELSIFKVFKGTKLDKILAVQVKRPGPRDLMGVEINDMANF